MSRSKDKNSLPIEGGRKCMTCKKPMQRFKHSPEWKPLPGRNYYNYWDRCFYCKKIYQYEEAKVFTKTLKPIGTRNGASTSFHKNFYRSHEWKVFRYSMLKKHGGKCQCCGSPGPLRVDHIKPISKYWELRLEESNAQVLCNDCNWGKGNHDETDWRDK